MAATSNRSLVEEPTYRLPLKSCMKDLSQSDSAIKTLRRSSTTVSLSDDESCVAEKQVFFYEVSIREYPQILGDNPAVTEGVPLALDWDHQNQYKVNVEMYEFTRAPVRRKSRRKLMMSSTTRFRTLIEAGYSLEDIGDAAMEVRNAKAQRLKSVQAFGWNGPLDFLSGAVETTGSAFRKVKRRGSKILMGGRLAQSIQKIKANASQPRRRSIANPAC